MNRYQELLVALLCIVQLAGVAGVAQNADSKPGAASPRPVAVLFSATDSNGNPVRDLSKERIRVLDNNSSATVADLRPVGEAPLSVGIVLLASKTNFPKEQVAAAELVRRLIRSDHDRAFVITAGGDKPWTQANLEWQTDRDALIKSINTLDKNTGIPDAFKYDLSIFSGDTTISAARWQIETAQGAGTSVFDAVWGMMMADNRPARRVLVMFRDAWAHAPGRSQRNREYCDHMHAQLVASAQKLHVAVYTIGVDEPSPASAGAIEDIKTNYGENGAGEMMREHDRQIRLETERLYNGGRANVERLADDTGGRAWWSDKSNFNDSVTGIPNALSGQYLLTFVPAAGSPGAHGLKVISSTGTRVAAPNAFLVAAPAAAVK
jgi:VWFA-related protein